MSEMVSQRIQQYLKAVADSEVSGQEQTRMMTLTMSAMTWVTAVAILMYVTELLNRRLAVELAVWTSLLLWIGYTTISRAPALAKGALGIQNMVRSSVSRKELKSSALIIVSGSFMLYTIAGSPRFVYLYVGLGLSLSVIMLTIVIRSWIRGEDGV